MSNVVNMDKLFNRERKVEFLSQYENSTQMVVLRFFKLSHTSEMVLDKDLSEFDRDELKRLFYSFKPGTSYVSKFNISWISKYIEWSIVKGYIKGVNPLLTVDSDWKEQFVTSKAKTLWTAKEIDEIIKNQVNYQDAVVVSLLFNGVSGDGLQEVVNLQRKDIRESDNTLVLRSNKTSRELTVDDNCIRLCFKAAAETEYEKMNGNPSPDIKSATANLVENDFVVKSANTKTINFYEADKNIVYRRLTKIANEIGEQSFIPRNIINSGMLYTAKQLYDVTGKLDEEEFKVVFEKFDENGVQNQRRIKDEFLNLGTIQAVYGTSN
ncbi:integrase [Paenibacillaceae bacterium]|nr:integrase [Paenibacillaceae bacterium]